MKDAYILGDVVRLVPRLKRRAARLCWHPSDAEDLMQEALMRLMQRMTHSGVAAPERYAMVILNNLARARWRRHTELTELKESTASILPVAEGRMAIETLCRAIDELPTEQAKVMRLVLAGEISPRDISDQLKLPLGTVMSRLARARATLRTQMGMTADESVKTLM